MKIVARPYAKAAFEYASEHQAIEAWRTFLHAAALLSQQPAVLSILSDSEVSPAKIEGIFCDLLSSFLDEHRKNFIHLLIQNRRAVYLPDIESLFLQHCAAQEQVLSVQVTSATPLSDRYQEKFITALSKRFDKKIALSCAVNPDLIGGAMIQIGDKVIDGTVSGKLSRLLESF